MSITPQPHKVTHVHTRTTKSHMYTHTHHKVTHVHTRTTKSHMHTHPSLSYLFQVYDEVLVELRRGEAMVDAAWVHHHLLTTRICPDGDTPSFAVGQHGHIRV